MSGTGVEFADAICLVRCSVWFCSSLPPPSSLLQLNDYLELQDYPQLLDVPAGQMCTLKIVPELYDERASRLHVRRLRELLVKPPAHIQPSAVQVSKTHTQYAH